MNPGFWPGFLHLGTRDRSVPGPPDTGKNGEIRIQDFSNFSNLGQYYKYTDMGKFEVKTDKAGKFRFNLKASNGQVILSSQGYSTKAACENGIESVKKNSQNDAMYERVESSNGKPYFNLKSSNGQVIGTSQMYSSEKALENGMDSVKKNAPGAAVEMEE